ncbi:hypothetical protein B0181_02920 [Moraxella caviae]|uniref:Uncharacterized protein n=1 Tax=Moraxella caviae TaxID=34060 RepID=A0A1T0A713_9GAMM|nr:hypothetical protein [Moraxella caviae]OOR91524.1 hypothetical protein B0181_02920 [Moraxella caviae]STZ14390.1 Uncharacterised protein [Moraxella caviae]VEW10523.1 Uncharacterised protein [Moraxella caviae]
MQSQSSMAQTLGVKMLVALLCTVSFIAGFYAHKVRQTNACQAMGAQVVQQGNVVVCVSGNN